VSGLTHDHLADPVSRVGRCNVANALTLLRLILVPVFVAVLFHDGGHVPEWRWLAWVVFAIAAFTDTFDGRVARRRGLVTDFGKIVDPIADKALSGAALIGLSVLGDLPWVVTVVVLTREVGVTALRFWVIHHGVIPASRGGKLKTMLQAWAIGLLLLPLSGGWHTAATAVMIAALVLTLATGLDYVARAFTLRRNARAA